MRNRPAGEPKTKEFIGNTVKERSISDPLILPRTKGYKKQPATQNKAKQPATKIDVNAPPAKGLRNFPDWLATKIDGNHKRWLLEKQDAVRYDEKNKQLIIEQASQPEVRLNVDEVERVLFKPLARHQGLRDLEIRVVKNGERHYYYGGTLETGSPQIKNAVTVLKKLKVY